MPDNTLYESCQSAESNSDPFWISYADLMTALSLLFLVVMSIAIVKITAQDIEDAKARREQIQVFLKTIENRAAEKKLDIDVDAMNHTIGFGSKSQFAHDSYELTADTVNQLQPFVGLLLKTIREFEDKSWLKRIHIEGFTDETGTYLYNIGLSLRRAQAVLCAMFEQNLVGDDVSLLQQLLIIDGASTTAIKLTPEESRRVEIRLEFRKLNDSTAPNRAINIALGKCSTKYQQK